MGFLDQIYISAPILGSHSPQVGNLVHFLARFDGGFLGSQGPRTYPSIIYHDVVCHVPGGALSIALRLRNERARRSHSSHNSIHGYLDVFISRHKAYPHSHVKLSICSENWSSVGIFLAILGASAGIAALAGWIAEAFTSRPYAAIVAAITFAALSVIFLLTIAVLRVNSPLQSKSWWMD